MSDKSKYVVMNDALYDYVIKHRSRAHDPLLEDLRAETEKLGDIARMLISREQGDLLTLLTKLLEVRSAVEIGTFTGYSAICLARGLAANGKLYCFDKSEEWSATAKRFWQREQLGDRIELRIGDAMEELAHWNPPESLDLAFIDADKVNYDNYFEILLPKMKTNGLFIFDNMVQGGRIVEQPTEDANVKALSKLNGKLAVDPRVEAVLLPISDGLQLARKR